VANHADDLCVNQLLGNRSALLGVGSVIFSHQLQGDLRTTDGDTGCVQFFNRHLGAVFIVFTQVGNRAAGWTNVGNGDNGLGRGKTGRQGNNRSCNNIQLHIFSSKKKMWTQSATPHTIAHLNGLLHREATNICQLFKWLMCDKHP